MDEIAERRAFELFYSYARIDEKLLARLETCLAQFTQQQQIAPWHRQKIVAGVDAAQEIDAHLNTAQLILLLISPDFLASDYCYRDEMRRALERHSAGQARVIPILLRPTDWSNAPFVALKALPDNGKAITAWSNRDKAFLNVAQGIRRAIEDLQTRPAEQRSVVSQEQPRKQLLDAIQIQVATGHAQPASVFLNYAQESLEEMGQLQLQLNVRGVRCWHEIVGRQPDRMTRDERVRAIEQEGDALVLSLTRQRLASATFWEIDVAAALRRRERDPHFHMLLTLYDLSVEDLRLFCAARNLPDLLEANDVEEVSGQTPEARERQIRSIARRLLQVTLATHLRRGSVSHTYEPIICLRNYQYAPPAPILDLDLNWFHLIPEKERLPTSVEWEEILLPALRDVKQILSAEVHSHRLQLFLKVLLPVAIAFGFTFRKSSGFTLLMTDQYGSWSTEGQPTGPAPLRQFSFSYAQSDPKIAVIELAITRPTEYDVRDALRALELVPGHHLRLEPLEGPSQSSIRDANQALAMAHQIAQVCRELCDKHAVSHIHLFAAISTSLGVLIGHQLNALCPVTLYEFQRGVYQPLGTLQS